MSSTTVELPSVDTEPLASVLNTLRLERLGNNRYRGNNMPQLSGRVYGGQVLAQATVAASDTLGVAPEIRLAHSITAAFLRPGRVEVPTEFMVEELNDGRSFSTRNVSALQNGHIIFTARVSFQLHQPGPSFRTPMPDAPAPEYLPSSVDFFAGLDSHWGHVMSTTNAVDLRHVDGDIYIRPAEDHSTHQQIWLRTRSPMPEGSSKLLQRAMLGYSADQFMLEPVMRATGLHWANTDASLATLDHSIWWHRNFDMSDWILADLESPSAQNGRGLVIAKFFQNGRHIATMSQEGMVRVRTVTHRED
ncbi:MULTISPECIES: acyl-CoA thioesterase domain-containing protein [unclassified Actinobaculum]|uniref:acyl-CoA thioesterase n=1 Tax=unclassified Actinobaculum TaxID=2609299 RepID=UPI000D52A6FC|nr:MULTISPECIES: acyl-CoA thioesterase domain-containing protein [unclassified Actinobaculum]AWE42759.1 acyl-CoA thioesterase II [Actinobaculum sp. 313]RTE49574.1 acyl-CoA thioesterase II [Actinobaculum sp. 352]